MRNLFFLALLCVLIFGAMAVMRHHTPLVRERGTTERLADFSYTRLDGTTGRLSDHRDRPVILHFWATWCPPCIKELPELIDKAASLQTHGDILLISVDRDQSELRRFLHPFMKKITAASHMTIIHDLDMKIALAQGVTTFPETILLSADGYVTRHFRGPVQWNFFDFLRYR